MSVPPPPKLRPLRTTQDARALTFVVGGEDFVLPKPFITIHSPHWAKRLAEQPGLTLVELDGDPASFRSYLAFLRGAQGADGEVTAENVEHLLHWSQVFQVDYIVPLCEDLLLNRPPPGFEPDRLMDFACRYNLPMLYSRATESLAQGMGHMEVPEGRVQAVFADKNIREDIVDAHLSMGTMRGDSEARVRQRFADFTKLEGNKQRARLLWKARPRLPREPEEPPPADWKMSPSIFWPHHSMRDETWAAAPAETQPTGRIHHSSDLAMLRWTMPGSKSQPGTNEPCF